MFFMSFQICTKISPKRTLRGYFYHSCISLSDLVLLARHDVIIRYWHIVSVIIHDVIPVVRRHVISEKHAVAEVVLRVRAPAGLTHLADGDCSIRVLCIHVDRDQVYQNGHPASPLDGTHSTVFR